MVAGSPPLQPASSEDSGSLPSADPHAREGRRCAPRWAASHGKRGRREGESSTPGLGSGDIGGARPHLARLRDGVPVARRLPGPWEITIKLSGSI